MAANSSIILTNIDFDTHKNTLKQYLKSQDRFKDYDFEGSNINVLLDILSYNTFHNAFYLNMIGNEMFMDSAQLRDSVVSHAKELNYTPRSFKSAEANVNISIVSNDVAKRSIAISRGTTFTSPFMNRNYTFSTNENIVLTDYTINANNTITFLGSNITLYEGYYVTDTFTFTAERSQRFVLTNKNVDISSLIVTVIEDVGNTVLTHTRAQSLFNLNSESRVYFLQACENDQYEILLGDGVSGRKPKDNSIISVEYRISNGQLPNGCNVFNADGTIDGESRITISTNTSAASGSVSEDIDSIKYNAPRHFTTQERAVTTEDYENLLKQSFPEINTVSAYGGEDLDPPQFGKVFVAVDLVDVDGVPAAKKDEYYRFLKPRSPVSIDPVFVNPEYLYIGVNSSVKYNINTTKLTQDDIKTLVSTAIINYAQANLNDFNRVFRYSKAVQAIDNAQAAIISNETTVRAIKIINPSIGINNTLDVKFQIPLDTSLSVAGGGYTVQSTKFVFNNQRAALRDNGAGSIDVYSVRNGQTITSVGTVNYENGLIQLSNFNVSQYDGVGIKIYAIPRNKDIQTINNVILNIIEEDIDLTIVPVRD
jgi:hypothetical protein